MHGEGRGCPFRSCRNRLESEIHRIRRASRGPGTLRPNGLRGSTIGDGRPERSSGEGEGGRGQGPRGEGSSVHGGTVQPQGHVRSDGESTEDGSTSKGIADDPGSRKLARGTAGGRGGEDDCMACNYSVNDTKRGGRTATSR